MNMDWKRLSGAVRAARSARGLGQEEFAVLVGISKSSLQTIERGHPFKGIPASVYKIEAYLEEWPQGTAERILAGGDPPGRIGAASISSTATTGSPSISQPPLRERAFADGMPLRIAQELTEGEVVDTAVLDLSGEGGNSSLVMILKRDDAENIDPEQLRRDLEVWKRAKRALHGITTESDDQSA
ncbi:helix-turn-helix transcriptional regulator [Embleya sp. NPDC005971]|uniref:helix-turn-helix domain-containing protein n=1 Tax=Embleya sp. NPDC005971 TaxID=3156724 RepID=UPI0033FC584D